MSTAIHQGYSTLDNEDVSSVAFEVTPAVAGKIVCIDAVLFSSGGATVPRVRNAAGVSLLVAAILAGTTVYYQFPRPLQSAVGTTINIFGASGLNATIFWRYQ